MPAFKRGSVWYARFEIDGHKFKKSLGARSTRQDALAWEARVRRDHVAGRVGKAADRTIDEAINKWLDLVATKPRRDTQGDEARARAWLPFVEGRQLRDAVEVAEAAVAAWQAEGLLPATINRRLALIRRVCRLAHSQWKGWLDVDLSRRFPALEGEVARKHYPTRAEVMRLVKAAPKPLNDAIMLAAYTGLRQSELLRLTKADVIDGCVSVKIGKTKASIRLVPVPKIARPLLKRLPFPFTKGTLRHAWDAVRAQCNMQHVRWHDLRHSYGSRLAEAGAPLTAIRDVMGHSTLIVTNRYLHTVPEHVKEVVEKLK